MRHARQQSWAVRALQVPATAPRGQAPREQPVQAAGWAKRLALWTWTLQLVTLTQTTFTSLKALTSQRFDMQCALLTCAATHADTHHNTTTTTTSLGDTQVRSQQTADKTTLDLLRAEAQRLATQAAAAAKARGEGGRKRKRTAQLDPEEAAELKRRYGCPRHSCSPLCSISHCASIAVCLCC